VSALSLDIRVSKRTIQKYMKQIRPTRASGQSWKIFLRNHAAEVWACDSLQVGHLFFRPLFAFFLIELRVAEGDARERDAISDGSQGSTTTAGGDCVWANANISHSG
jgi:hypothetical protein